MEATNVKCSQMLLLEIFTNEIPPSFQTSFGESLKEVIINELNSKNIAINKKNVTLCVTPLRLAYLCPLLPLSDRVIIFRGPKINSNPNAINGFLKKFNLKSKNQLKEVNDFYEYHFKPTKESIKKELGEVLLQSIQKSVKYWPKKMSWLPDGTKWIRPIDSIVAMLNTEVIPLTFANVSSSNFTYPSKRQNLDNSVEKKIIISNSNNYLQIMKDQHIMISESERSYSIIDQLKEIETINSLKVGINLLNQEGKDLLQKNANVSENPQVLVGKISNEFFFLPKIILKEVMIQNQNFIPLTKNGKLTHFAFIVERKTYEGNQEDVVKFEQNTIKGHESVLSARLKDAVYFFNDDIKRFGNIDASNKDDLKIVKNELSSIMSSNTAQSNTYNRCCDIIQIFEFICNEYKIKNNYNLLENKELLLFAKLDLKTKVVNDLTELQGLIGGYYWETNWGKNIDKKLQQLVKQIISHQYIKDSSNESKIVKCFAISDALENISFNLNMGRTYSSSADPFGIYKSAASIIMNSIAIPNTKSKNNIHIYSRQEIESGINLSMSDLINTSVIDIELSEKGIESILPQHYKCFAKEIKNILVKTIERIYKKICNLETLKPNNSVHFGLSMNNKSLSSDTIGIRFNDTLDNNRSIFLSQTAFNSKNKEIILHQAYSKGLNKFINLIITQLAIDLNKNKENVDSLYIRMKGLSKLNMKQVQQIQQYLTEEEKNNLKSDISIDKLISIYFKISQANQIQDLKYKNINIEISKIRQNLQKINEEREEILSQLNIKQDTKKLIQNLNDFGKKCSLEIQKVSNEINDILKNNVINVENCIYSLTMRKLEITKIVSIIETLYLF